MKRRWLLGIGLVSVLVLVALCSCNTAPSTVQISSQQEGILASGRGEVTVVPDVATLRLGIAAEAATVDEAKSQATEAMNKVMDALADNDVAEKDIQTQYFNIRQVTKWDKEKEEETVVGYRVTNMVTAKVREIDKTGIVIDAVVKAGGDLIRIDDISFSVDDPSAYYEEAREKAMADAKSKAEHLAELGGVSLGKPIYISESAQTPPVIYRGDLIMEAEVPVPAPAPTPISAGELDIVLTVQVIYSIK